jgi:cytochrome P450
MMFEAFERCTPLFMEEIKNREKDSQGFVDFDIKPIMDKVMNEIYTTMAFGDYCSLSEEEKMLSIRIEDVFGRHNESMTDTWAIFTKRLSAKLNFSPNRKNVAKDFASIHKVLSGLYDARHKELSDPNFVNTRYPNFLDHMITENIRDKTVNLTKEEMLDDMWNTILPSVDGVRSALMNTFYLLGEYPEEQKAVYNELIHFGLDKDKEAAGPEKYDSLKLTTAFILE